MSLEQDARFLEEYKRLDALCRDIYQNWEKGGISLYLRDMERRGLARLPEYQSLRRLRHARNKLVHEPGTVDRGLYTREDVAWLGRFRQRILQGTDPLTQAGKRENTSKPAPRRKKSVTAKASAKERKDLWAVILPLAGILAVLLYLVLAGG